MDLLPEERQDVGLQAVFKSVFPFSDFRETCALEFVSYRIGEWKSRSGRLEGPAAPALLVRALRRDREGEGSARDARRVRRVRPPEREQGHDRRGLRDPGRAAPPVLGGRVPGARLDVLGAAQGDVPPQGVRQGERSDGEGCPEGVADPRHQGRRGLLRRDPAHDGQRDVRHQRDGARHRLAAPPLARRLLHARGRAHAHRQDHSVPRLLGGVRDRPQGPLRRPHRPQAQVPGDRVPPRARPRERRADPQEVLLPGEALVREGQGAPRPPARGPREGRAPRQAPPRHPQGRPHLRGRQADGRDEGLAREGRERRGVRRPGEARPGPVRRRRRRPRLGRGALRDRLRDPRGSRRAAREQAGDGRRGDLPGLGADRRDAHRDPPQGRRQDEARGAARDLQAHAPRRPADGREREEPLRGHVLRPAEVRLLARRPLQVQHPHGPLDVARPEDPHGRGLLRRDRAPPRAQARHRQDRRHRQPRQPPRPLRRRAPREPVPDRPRPHGARDQGKDVRPPGHRLGDAARPHQLQARHRGDQGVLRVVAALAVHGPDEPPLRGHAQEASLGPRAGRPLARARRVRGARRPRHALRPHLPDRDAGRPEHRPHLVALVLRPHLRVRVHREPVQEGQERARPRPLRDRHRRRLRVEEGPDRRGRGARGDGRRA